ncbi:MAG TPA: membrane protein insertase YidC [Gemmatimonadaceae bacterium]
MEKRVLIAVLLSFLVLYAYQALYPPPPEPKPGTPAAAQAPPDAKAAPPSASKTPAPATPAAAPLPAPEPGQQVVVDGPAVRAVFDTRGATLASWELKKYSDAAGRPLELVPPNAPSGSVRPFTLAVDDTALTATLARAVYTPSATHVDLTTGQPSVRFEYREGDLVVQKTFAFDAAHPYVITFSETVTRGGRRLNPIIEWGPALGDGITVKTRSYNPPPQPMYFRDGKVKRIDPKKIPDQPSQEGDLGFAGVDDHYFLSAVINPAQPLHIEYQPVHAPVPGVEQGAQWVSWAVRFPAPPDRVTYFLGPKDFDVLASVNRDLVRAIDFGMFSWLVVPLLRALKWINVYIGNYGWSLIILTILINLAMFPLRHKSVVSMRKMQEIQPEVKAIQERYSKLKMSDPARGKMNTELMNLYRERGVNPASGCIPMLLTLPVLFAFYSLLAVAIELRGAPFTLWIHDLSAHDPLYITPILMGITQLVQQWMVPSGADPMQQKMMMIMPVVFTGMFLWAPSGLVIYWTTTNLWGIGQQMVTNKLIGPPPQHTIRPPAERRVKKVGSGKTNQAAKERE